MKKQFTSVRAYAMAIVTMLATTSSLAADVVSGKLWHVDDTIAQDAVLANVPNRTPDVTFDVNSPLNFDSPNSSVQSFLGSGSAFNIIENTAGTLSSLMSDGAIGTLISFSGIINVTNGQQFTVTHDDGLTLVIGNLDLGFSPGPTGATTSVATYTGPTGEFPFQLVYGECCSGSAVLQVDLPFTSPVPEPASSVLLLTGLSALIMRRRHAASSRVGRSA